jgi:uracil-DNA glycosylase family 4
VLDLISKLKEFYLSRRDFISFDNVDYTDVYDPYLDEKVSNPIMIIGEAPGANEVKEKEPFVGMAGKNLDYLISLSKYDRKKDILITNAFPFRTYEGNKNRTPNTKELKEGAKLLLEEIKIVKPKLILLLGNSSIKAFSYLPLQNAKEVKKFERNSINKFDFGFYKTKIGVTFHPSPISFNRKDIKVALEKFFKEI